MREDLFEFGHDVAAGRVHAEKATWTRNKRVIIAAATLGISAVAVGAAIALL